MCPNRFGAKLCRKVVENSCSMASLWKPPFETFKFKRYYLAVFYMLLHRTSPFWIVFLISIQLQCASACGLSSLVWSSSWISDLPGHAGVDLWSSSALHSWRRQQCWPKTWSTQHETRRLAWKRKPSNHKSPACQLTSVSLLREIGYYSYSNCILKT